MMQNTIYEYSPLQLSMATPLFHVWLGFDVGINMIDPEAFGRPTFIQDVKIYN